MHVRFLSCSLYLSRSAHTIATIVADCNHHIFVVMSIILLKKNQNSKTFLDCASPYGCTFYSLFLSISFRFFHSESDFLHFFHFVSIVDGFFFSCPCFWFYILIDAASLFYVQCWAWHSRAMWFLFSVGKLIYWICREYARSSMSFYTLYLICFMYFCFVWWKGWKIVVQMNRWNINGDRTLCVQCAVCTHKSNEEGPLYMYASENLNDVNLWWI